MGLRILTVCTANECRSPTAALLLQRHLDAADVAATVESAGVASFGREVHPDSARELRRLGVDVPGHSSRAFDAALIASADLVIGMARAHVWEVVTLEPDAWKRSFTMKELVRLAEERPRAGQPFSPWIASLSAGREARDLLGESSADDVADPIGRPRKVFRATALELDELSRRFADAAR